MGNRNRNLTIDYLKITLSFSVVAIHAQFLKDIDQNLGYILTNGLFRVAVPAFLIINGYYLFSIIENGLFCSWLKRSLLLYAFWMTAYLPIWAFAVDPGALALIHRMIFGFHHLWYVAGIIGGGACLYAMSTINSTTNSIFAIASFIIGVLIQYAGAYDIFSPPIDTILSYNWSHRNFLFLAFPFMYTGFCIKKFNLSNTISGRTTLVLSALGFVALLIECSINLSFNIGADGFDNLLSLAIICPTAVLLALRSKKAHGSKSLSLVSSGIYFIHPAAICLLARTTPNSILIFLFASALSIFAAILLTRINQRFPYIL